MKSVSTSICYLFAILLTACPGGKTEDPVPPEDPRNKFVGTYNMYVSCQTYDGGSSQATYTLTVSKSGNDQSIILLQNLFGTGQNIIGILRGKQFDTSPFDFPAQNVVYSIDARGNFFGASLGIDYKVHYEGQEIGTCHDEGMRNTGL